MGHLFGNSTVFPFGPDYIEIVRHAVEAGVQLLAAQRAMGKALRRNDTVEQQQESIRVQLVSLGDALLSTLEPFLDGPSERVARVSKQIRERSKELIAAEGASLEGAVTEKMSSSRTAVEAARQNTFRAIETFVLRHDLPDTEVGLHLHAEETRYRGQALVTTPFGVEAVFDLAIPAAHDWGQPRRVVEMSAGTEVHVPTESGIFTKRIESRPVKLDRLFITEVAISNARTLITLRKGPRSGSGYQIEVLDDDVPRAVLSHITEDGGLGPEEPLPLGDEDSVHALRLWNRVLDSSADLPARRQAMTEATFEGKSIMEIDEPRRVCEKLVEVMAPVVQQLGRNSGAPGELVIRRDVGEGRREEVFITKAELQEKVLALPEDLQAVFAPFELGEGPISPRAPTHTERVVFAGLAPQED
jgi:hypothetical protein